jgi:tetratricopeptide (TPR) repeat protein
MSGLFKMCGVAAAALASFGASASTAGEPPSQPSVQQPYSNFLPPLESLALPGEQVILDRFLARTKSTHDPALILQAADEALALLRSPTQLRGFIQLTRARALGALHRELDAVEAAEESAQLLPGYSAPLILAFQQNAYLSRTAQATEYLMRAIEADPVTARTIDDYEINNLLGRLNGFHDDARARAISDRLLKIGWIGSHLDSRSSLAVDAIKMHIDRAEAEAARALVPRLLDPKDSRDLLIMKAYSAVWPDIETWAGHHLERQWPIYLREARERWESGRTSIAARDYLSALTTAGEFEAAVRELLPLFDNPRKGDVELIFMVAPLANSLARLGRWDDAEDLFRRAQRAWPLGSQANALNVSANHSVLLLKQGRANDALQMMDASLTDARKWGPEVSAGALAAMHHERACMLHDLGRDPEAAASVAQALAVQTGSAAAMLHLCMGDPAAARQGLLDALGNESTRDDVVGFVQPSDERPFPSPYGLKQRAASEALRSDPQVLSAVAKYGRVLPWRLNEAVREARTIPTVSAR